MRLASFLVACGLILGRSVAGDWHSTDQTVQDFLRISPFVAVLVVLAFVIEHIGRPTAQRPHQPFVSHGLGLGAAYVLIALVALAFLGWPE
jgi:thiosulfate reductase cytochrome b subunit